MKCRKYFARWRSMLAEEASLKTETSPHSRLEAATSRFTQATHLEVLQEDLWRGGCEGVRWPVILKFHMLCWAASQQFSLS